jgi:hypothetical protein
MVPVPVQLLLLKPKTSVQILHTLASEITPALIEAYRRFSFCTFGTMLAFAHAMYGQKLPDGPDSAQPVLRTV